MYDALKSVWKEKGKSKRKGKGKIKRKGKEKSKRNGKEKGKTRISRRKEHQDTVEHEMLLLQGKGSSKSLRWPSEKKTMSHELSKLTMIDRDASVHVCLPKKTAKGDSFRKSSKTRPLPGAEMQELR